MTTFLFIAAGWAGVCLIAWALVRGGSMVERAWEREAEIRRIRQQLGYEK